MDPAQSPEPQAGPPTGAAVRRFRHAAGLTTYQLARKAGVKWVQLRNLEAGLPAPPHVLAAVLAALGRGAGDE